MEPHVGRPEHGGTFVEVTDNPSVRLSRKTHDHRRGSDLRPATDRPGRISDHFRRHCRTEIAARVLERWLPPADLSVITSARHGGAVDAFAADGLYGRN